MSHTDDTSEHTDDSQQDGQVSELAPQGDTPDPISSGDSVAGQPDQQSGEVQEGAQGPNAIPEDETGEPFHVQQRKQIEVFREAWKEAGHEGEPRVSVSRSIMPITTDLDRMYFGREGTSQDQFGQIEANLRAVFGKTYAAEPDVLVKELADDEAVAAADTLLLTVPNQLGVDYNAHVIESVVKHLAPELGWR